MSKSFFGTLSSYRPQGEGMSREDFFTEVWAHVLSRHPALLRDVLSLIGFESEGQACIDTQADYGASTLPGSAMRCYPDLRVTVGERVLLCEHKIDAHQHEELVTLEDGTEASYSQLERYLNVRGEPTVVFIALGTQPVKASVLEHARYLAPEGRPQFLWSDFYDLVKEHAEREGVDAFLQELVPFMEDLFMQPAREGVGVIPSANVEGMKAEREALKRHWLPALRYLDDRGWKKLTHGLEIEVTRGERYPALFFDMRYGEKAGVRDGVLKARLRVLEGTEGMDEVVSALAGRGLEATRVTSSASIDGVKRPAVDVVATTRETRTAWVGDGEMGERLRAFVEMVEKEVAEVLED